MARPCTFDEEIILQKMMQIFWEKGYNGTSMQDLVDISKLNRSSIYNSLGSKKDIYMKCLHLYTKENGNHIANQQEKQQQPLSLIKAIFKSYIPQIIEDNKGCMLLNCRTEMVDDYQVSTFLCKNQDEMISFFEDLVHKGQQDGSIKKEDSPLNYAWYLYSAFQGLRMTGILNKNVKQLHTIIERSIEAIEQ